MQLQLIYDCILSTDGQRDEIEELERRDPYKLDLDYKKQDSFAK